MRILSWNIGFGGGRYGLQAGKIGPVSAVEKRLRAISEAIRHSDPDIVCIQEIDRCSKRSFYIDQVSYLSDYPYCNFVPTWQSKWVPYPTTWRVWQHFGPIDAGQVVFSKYPIAWHSQIVFDKPRSRKGLQRYFYLDRVVQFLSINTKEGSLTLVHAHLEAFDRETRQLQAKQIRQLFPLFADQPLICCGDLNAIVQVPDRPYIFPDEPDLDYADDDTLEILCSAGVRVAGLHSCDYPSDAPNRQLTYVLHSADIDIQKYTLLETGLASDHLPALVVFDLKH